MTTYIARLAIQLGPLRLMLAALAVMVAAFALEPGSETILEGWRIVPTLVFPAITPIVFMMLLLDLLMARVWLSDADGAERKRFKTVMLVNVLLAVLILFAWAPFFVALRR